MYAGTVFLGGKHGELGADAVFEESDGADLELIASSLERHKVASPAWRLSQSGRRPATLELSSGPTRDLWKVGTVSGRSIWGKSCRLPVLVIDTGYNASYSERRLRCTHPGWRDPPRRY